MQCKRRRRGKQAAPVLLGFARTRHARTLQRARTANRSGLGFTLLLRSGALSLGALRKVYGRLGYRTIARARMEQSSIETTPARSRTPRSQLCGVGEKASCRSESPAS